MTPPQVVRIGVVATNQERKDWGLMAQVAQKLAEVVAADGRTLKVWWHTDTLKRAWDFDALLTDFGLTEIVEVTLAPMAEQELVRRYRQCDVTLAPGSEGFGYPIFESLACGVPVIHGDYASGASIMRTCGLEDLLVKPIAGRLEGQHNALRPVHDMHEWVWRVVTVLEMKQEWRGRVAHLDWPNLGPRFLKWFNEGIHTVQI
jgi:glycosyltransferase involved in cell wall biosynthesis